MTLGNEAGRRPIVRRETVAGALIVGIQLVQLLSLLFWALVIPNTILVFAQGFSWEALMFVLPVWAYPLLPVGCGVGAWILFRHDKIRQALIVASLPLVIALPLIAVVYGALPS